MPSAHQRTFDLSLPLRARGKARQERPETEDPALTEFLTEAMNDVLSVSTEPPACAFCRSRNTKLRSVPTPRQPLPNFACADCGQKFNRATGTALSHQRDRKALYAFVPYLSQQLPYLAVAEILGIQQITTTKRTRRFRKWLLDLDPSGFWEAKVRLGVRPPPPLMDCPRCAKQAEARPTGNRLYVDRAGPMRAHKARRMLCLACNHVFVVKDSQVLKVAIPAQAPTRPYHGRAEGPQDQSWRARRTQSG